MARGVTSVGHGRPSMAKAMADEASSVVVPSSVHDDDPSVAALGFSLDSRFKLFELRLGLLRSLKLRAHGFNIST